MSQGLRWNCWMSGVQYINLRYPRVDSGWLSMGKDTGWKLSEISTKYGQKLNGGISLFHVRRRRKNLAEAGRIDSTRAAQWALMLMHRRCTMSVIRPCVSVNKMPNEGKQCYRLRMISHRVFALSSRIQDRTPPPLIQHARSRRDWSTRSFRFRLELSAPTDSHISRHHVHLDTFSVNNNACEKKWTVRVIKIRITTGGLTYVYR